MDLLRKGHFIGSAALPKGKTNSRLPVLWKQLSCLSLAQAYSSISSMFLFNHPVIFPARPTLTIFKITTCTLHILFLQLCLESCKVFFPCHLSLPNIQWRVFYLLFIISPCENVSSRRAGSFALLSQVLRTVSSTGQALSLYFLSELNTDI